MRITEWTPEKIKRLRGRRTQAELGKIIRVPKNTIWRWEAGYARPDAERSRRLDRIAKKERHVEDWKLEGSAKLLGDLEAASRHLGRHFKVTPGSLTAKLQ
jgi:transcriptional regulator with XRE-family HTH domain